MRQKCQQPLIHGHAAQLRGQIVSGSLGEQGFHDAAIIGERRGTRRGCAPGCGPRACRAGCAPTLRSIGQLEIDRYAHRGLDGFAIRLSRKEFNGFVELQHGFIERIET